MKGPSQRSRGGLGRDSRRRRREVWVGRVLGPASEDLELEVVDRALHVGPGPGLSQRAQTPPANAEATRWPVGGGRAPV